VKLVDNFWSSADLEIVNIDYYNAAFVKEQARLCIVLCQVKVSEVF
jgi:hypothetical protein